MGRERRTDVRPKPNAPPLRVATARKPALRSSSLRCTCGKLVNFYSTLLGRGFCGDACYEKARAKR